MKMNHLNLENSGFAMGNYSIVFKRDVESNY